MYEIKIYKTESDSEYTMLTRSTMEEVSQLLDEVPIKEFHRVVVEDVSKKLKKK